MKNRQQGIALPVALILFVVMLMSSLYIMRSATTATVATGNLSVQKAFARATDVGIETAHSWLLATAAASKQTLENNSAANGYVAIYPSTGANVPATYLDSIFWDGATTVNLTDAAGSVLTIQYVIHRQCIKTGAYNATGNACVASEFASTSSSGVAAGVGLGIDASAYQPPVSVHYLVTSRIIGGAKGATAVNESVVIIGT